MTEAEARALLEDNTQWSISPALTTEEVDRLLARARVADASGYVPGDATYTNTWTVSSIRRASAQGWRMKAGKVAAQYDVAAGGGTSFNRSQQYQMCMEQAKQYGNGIGSLHVGGPYGRHSV